MNAIEMMESAKSLSGEVKEDKRAAEKRFFIGAATERQLRENAVALEIADKALTFMASEFARRAPAAATEAMDHFIDMMRVSASSATAAAEEEAARQLEFALWFHDLQKAERKVG